MLLLAAPLHRRTEAWGQGSLLASCSEGPGLLELGAEMWRSTDLWVTAIHRSGIVWLPASLQGNGHINTFSCRIANKDGSE